MTRTEPGAGLSLEYKLPLLITALLVATMATWTFVAYLEVKRSSLENLLTRLEFLTRDLASVLEPTIPLRLDLLGEIAASPEVRAFLTSPSRRPELNQSVEAAFGRLHLANQADMRLYIMGPSRDVLFTDRPEVGTTGLPVEHITPGSFSPFFEFGPGVYFWTVVPVLAETDTIGFVGELRRVGGTGGANPFEALIGQDARILFGNTAGEPLWVTVNGQAVPAQPADSEDVWEYADPDGTRYFAHARPIGATPWQVIARAPVETALARPGSFLRHALLTALAVALLGTIAAWILSRRITNPLRSLRFASAAIAKGEYDRRVPIDRGDELGILAGAFNHMAEQVQRAHQELTAQYHNAQELALERDRASRAKSEFLATMSHEIRTPINAIIGYTDLLLLGVDGPVNDAQIAQLERVRVSGRHLVNLVDQVLDLARVESGRLHVSTHPERASASVATMLTVLRPQAESKGVQVIDECSGDGDLWYMGDRPRVDQILVNLLSNAIKFTEAGGSVTIRCYAESRPLPFDGRPGPWTCLSIEDTGVGIDPEHLETIFEPFVQVDTGYTRRHGGAGLGLSISLRLARSMGGDLTVSSDRGRGSTFTLWLPGSSAEDRNERTRMEPLSEASTAAAAGARSVEIGD